jgi:hypothetical protein
MIYVSFKIIVAVRRQYADDTVAAVARTWARALAVSLAIVSVGLWFLPAGHHVLFWVYSGLAGALYQATRAHDPQFSLRRVLMIIPRRDP